MLKGKDYTWQQSNLSIVGTDLERNVKKASAETEQAWQGAGKDVGQQIWRIEKFKVVPWNQDNYGSFYSGDSYIILNTYREGEELKHNLHFWIGRHSTRDEYATAAYKAVELDTFVSNSDPTLQMVSPKTLCVYKPNQVLQRIKLGALSLSFSCWLSLSLS
eukprot:scpid97993/ scgid5892/ Gelsolin-like protein 1; Actin-modulator